MPRDTLIQIRRGSYSEWLLANPTLAAGEIAFISDRCELAIGDGLTEFSGLYNAGGCIIGSGNGGGGGTVNDTFKYINVSGQELIVASGEDTLNILAGHGINIQSLAIDNTITFAVSGLVGSDISDLNTYITGVLGTKLEPGDNIDFSYNSIQDILTINATGVVTKNSDGDVYILGDLSVVGDFNVQGSSTIFNSTNVNIGDNVITLNIVDVVPSGGILVVRSGILPTGYASFLWQENNSRWEASSGLYTPNLYTDNIYATNISGYLDGRAACANTVLISGHNLGLSNNVVLLTPVADSGCQTVVSESSLIYDASNDTLIAPYFSGEFLGYAQKTYTVDAVETTDNINYNIVLVETPGSGVYLKANNGGLYYNPSLELLSVPLLSGAAVGPENIGILDYVIRNFTIKSSKIDGGTP